MCHVHEFAMQRQISRSLPKTKLYLARAKKEIDPHTFETVVKYRSDNLTSIRFDVVIYMINNEYVLLLLDTMDLKRPVVIFCSQYYFLTLIFQNMHTSLFLSVRK